MKLTAKVKLILNTTQKQALKQTLETANAARNCIAKQAFSNKLFNTYKLQKLVYVDVKDKFNLTAQMVVRCVSSVIDSYKADKKTQHTFRKHASIAYDSRILRWYTDNKTISIWSTGGRLKKISYICGDHHEKLLIHQQGESDLVYQDGEFYLFATCHIDDPQTKEFKDIVGVDLGIANIATDSDGKKFAGGQIKGLRKRHRRLRRKLQKKGTKSAKRLLKKRRKKESCFAVDVNHQISKFIVQKAKDTNRAIALEDLGGINDRTTVRKPQRAERYSWAFYQLKQFILYKAKLDGIQVFEIDPRNTSRTCTECDCIDSRNRKSQSEFRCVACGFSAHADIVAAENIRRVAVNQPYADKLLKCA